MLVYQRVYLLSIHCRNRNLTHWVSPAICEGAANGDGALHPQMPQSHPSTAKVIEWDETKVFLLGKSPINGGVKGI